MAIDFLIFGFLLISFTINLLPLGAFWVTPGLRTTANRFVINLLVINLIGCCILAPTLYLSHRNMHNMDDESMDGVTNGKVVDQSPLTPQMTQITGEGFGDVSFDNRSQRTEMKFLCNSTFCERLTIIEGRDEANRNNVIRYRDSSRALEPIPVMRCWSIDLAAALGALSVLLVVGDTWMAVRHPLQYHSRVSGVKSWVLIAVTWILGTLFGVMSALREFNFKCCTAIDVKNTEHMQIFSYTNSTIFSMIFACIYFVVIILLPFGFVCGMYWRIFSEAKENGVRMRQNGSSPLLQSATNLSHDQRNANLLMRRNSIASTSSCGGLHFQIDRKKHRDSTIKMAEFQKPTATTTLPPLSEPEEFVTEEVNENNVSINLANPSEEVRGKYSAKQFLNLRQSSQDIIDINRINTFRQIKSSPNLQKHNQIDRNSMNGHETTFHFHNTPHQSVQDPTMGASPKTLSYMTSIRRRLSNASSLFKQREESRAARISILVVIMFFVSYLPYGLLVLLQDRLIKNFPHSTQLAVFMILLANFISPFIFAYRNKRIRHGVTRLFGLDARSKEHRLQCKGMFLRYGTKARISVKRSSSKVSAYSMSSCKYLTPILKHTNKGLKNVNKCEENINETNTFLTSAQIENCAAQKSSLKKSHTSENVVDIVDTTVTIEPDNKHTKFFIFQVFCKSPKTTNFKTKSCTTESIEV